VVSQGEYLEYALARQRKYLGRIRPLYIQQRQAGEQIERLTGADEPDQPDEPDQTDTDSANPADQPGPRPAAAATTD
jgi:hypothetical protein